MSSGLFDWFGLESETAASPRYHDKRGDVIYLKCQAYGPHHKEQNIIFVRESTGRSTRAKRIVVFCLILFLTKIEENAYRKYFF
jgi:hypothetical protein